MNFTPNIIEVVKASLGTAIALNQMSKNDVAEIIARLKSNPENRNTKFVTPVQGKEMLGVSMPTFWKYCTAKGIPKRFVGRQVRFLESDLLKAMSVDEVGNE